MRSVRTGKVLFVTFWLSLLPAITWGQVVDQGQELKLDESITRDLVSGQFHEYGIRLKMGDFIQVRVEQIGVDAILSIRSANGKEVVTMNSPNGTEGFETLSFIASGAGNYIVKVDGSKENPSKNRSTYKIVLTAKRVSTDGDVKRIAAESQLFGAFQAKSITTDETENLIKRYEALIPVWRELKDELIVALIIRTIADLRSKGTKPPDIPNGGTTMNVDMRGKWNMVVEGEGKSIPVTLDLQQTDTSFAGTFSSHLGDGTIEKGSVSGGVISAIAKMEVQGQVVLLKLKGSVEGDKMSGSLSGSGLPAISFAASKVK